MTIDLDDLEDQMKVTTIFDRPYYINCYTQPVDKNLPRVRICQKGLSPLNLSNLDDAPATAA